MSVGANGERVDANDLSSDAKVASANANEVRGNGNEAISNGNEGSADVRQVTSKSKSRLGRCRWQSSRYKQWVRECTRRGSRCKPRAIDADASERSPSSR